MRLSRSALVAPLLAASLLAAGCGGGDGGDATAAPTPSAASSSASEEPDPLAVPISERNGCEGLMPADTYRETTLESPEGDLLRAADFPARGGSPVALVLLHQSDGVALCGWGPYATAAAAQGMPSVAFDLCGYGDSECATELEDDPAGQVALAVRHARTTFGVRRVVVVGASMGGANAALAAADGADVAGWVDVSAPNAWFVDRLLVDVAPQLRGGPPGLVVFARSEGDAAFRDAQVVARRAGARFLPADSGHGWELLTDDGGLTRIGGAVLDFATGVR